MIRASLLISLMLLLSCPSKAQDTPKVELFGGYSYAGSGSNGFDVSAAGNVNDWLGLVADFGGQYTRLDDQVSRRRSARTQFCSARGSLLEEAKE